MFIDSQNNGTDDSVMAQGNLTCFDHFDLKPAMVSILCEMAKNGTDSTFIHFNSVCCLAPVVVENKEEVVKEFFENMCFSSANNMTVETRDLCRIIPFVSAEPFTMSLLTLILLSILTPLGILANFLIIFTVMQCKKLKSTTGYFIMNLAIADLFCILALISYLVTSSQIDLQKNLKVLLIFSSIDVAIGSASLLNVTAASVERAIAVTKPMVYPLILRKERAKKVIIMIWAYCILLLVACSMRVFIQSNTYSSTIFYFAVSFSFIIPCIMVLVSYINISVKALKNLQMEKRIERSMLAVAMLNERRHKKNQKSSRSSPQMARELKLALNLTVMTVPFVFGWGYFMVGNIYEEITRTTLVGLQNWFLNMLPYLISCVNPVTYLLFTKTLRKEAIKILSKTFRKFTSLHHRKFSSNSTLLTSTRGSRSSECSETRMI